MEDKKSKRRKSYVQFDSSDFNRTHNKMTYPENGNIFMNKNNSPVSNSPWPLNKNTDNAFAQG